MSSPHYASVAARLLRRVPPPVPPNATAEQRGLLTIARALSARRKKQQWLRAGAAAVAVAAAVALGFGLRNLRSPSVAQSGVAPSVSVSVLQGSGASVVDAAQHRVPLHVGAAVAVGSRIETTPEGAAALRLSTGTELTLDGRSRLTLQERGPVQRFVLEAGGVSAKVAKLGADARFVVQTPDAEIEVRGTQFHVGVLAQAEACAPARTRLLVQEGTVEVRSGGQGVLIRAGQHWPEACGAAGAEPPAAPQAARAAALEERRAAPSARIAVEAPAPASASPSPSSPAAVASSSERTRSGLVAQTELFAEASRAASRGEVAVALGKYQELVLAYPASALAENAVVERMRLQKGAAAKREAERYLELYPAGFGKSEAKRILANP